MEWALGFTVAACIIAWALVIRYAAKSTEEEIKRRTAEKTSEVKDAQLEAAAKPPLSRSAILARMRAGRL